MDHGLALAKDYPYLVEAGGRCRRNMSVERAHISAVVRLASCDVLYATEWLFTQGPFAITMQVPDKFFYYDFGVYVPTERECGRVAGWHTMAVVGYGLENKVPYWLLKNSWGVHFGDGGYVKIHRGSNACRLAEHMHGATGRT